MKEKNLIMHRHSSYGRIRKDFDIYLVDTYGEAKKFLGLSKVIFTGGSIIPHGGQNPLDAIRKNSLVMHGPNIENFREIYKFLGNEKISFKINNLNQIKKLIKRQKSNITNTKIKLNKISSKILVKTKSKILKYV